jgi:hypothetical protein
LNLKPLRQAQVGLTTTQVEKVIDRIEEEIRKEVPCRFTVSHITVIKRFPFLLL